MLSLPCTAYDRILLCLFLVFLTLFWAFLSFQIHPKLDLVNIFTFPAAEKDQDLDAETRIWGMVIPAADFSEKIAVDLFAEMVDQKVEDLETHNQYKVASKNKVADGDNYTKYSYTGNIAVVKVEDVTTGYTGYVGVMTVTCTPAEATASL